MTLLIVLVVVLAPVTLRTRRRGCVGLRGARSRSFDTINYWPLVRQSIVDTLQIQSTKYFLIQSITDPWPDNPNLICDDLTFTSSWCYCTIVLGTEAFHFYACLESKYHLTSEYGIWVGKAKIDCINVINYLAIWKTGQDSIYPYCAGSPPPWSIRWKILLDLCEIEVVGPKRWKRPAYRMPHALLWWIGVDLRTDPE